MRPIALYILGILLVPVIRVPEAAAQQTGEVYPEKAYRLQFPEQQADTAAIRIMIDTARQIGQRLPDSAISLLLAALDQSRRADYPEGVIRSLTEAGKIYFNTGLYDKSMAAFQQALYYSSKSAQGRRRMAGILDVISTLYQVHGNYEEAAKYLYQAALVAQTYGPASAVRISYIYNNLGALLYRIGQRQQATAYLNLAERMGYWKQDHALLASVLLNKAIIHAQQREWDSSNVYFKRTLQLATLYGLKELQHNTLLNMGTQYLQRDMPRQALPYLKQALALKESTTLYYRNAVTIALGEAYYRQKDYARAEHFLRQALRTGEATALNNDLLDVHKLLARVYEESGRYGPALQHYKDYMLFKDSLTSQHVLRDINQLEIRYQTASKDRELIRRQLQIARQESNLKRKNIWIGTSLAGTLLLVLLSVSLYRNYRRRQHLHDRQIQILRQEQEILKQQQEIERLRAGMEGGEQERSRIGQELHDGVGGMLTAINMNLTAIQERHRALPEMRELAPILGMLQATATEIRKTAHNLMPDLLLHYSLPEALHLYCEQMQTGTLKIDLQHYGPLDELDKTLALTLYRIMQELIQNIVKHARATQAEIQIRQHGTIISSTVEDNGAGFDSSREQGGLGLKNLHSRIQALQGHISVESAPGAGTTVYIELDTRQMQSTPHAS